MKNLIFKFKKNENLKLRIFVRHILLPLIGACSIQSAAWAQVSAAKAVFISPGSSGDYQILIEEIERASNEKNYNQGFMIATQLVYELHSRLKVNELVAYVKTSMTKEIDQVVTEKTHSESSYDEGFNINLFVFGSASYEGSWSSSSNQDVTKNLVKNPEEVAEFDAKVQNEREAVKSEIKKYVADNSLNILLLKEAGQKAFEMAIAARKAGQAQLIRPEDIHKLASLVTDLSFRGQQTVTSCVKTNYADRFTDSAQSSSQSASGSLFFFSASGQQNSNSYNSWQQMAHSKTSCESTTNKVALGPNDKGFLINFTQVDQQLLAWKDLAIGSFYLTLEGSYVYPTFGNSYFE